MKFPLVVLSVLAAAAITGFYQHRTLTALREESRTIRHSLAEQEPPHPAARSEADGEAALDEAEARLVALLSLKSHRGAEAELQLLDALRKLDATGIAALIARVKSRDEIPQEMRDRCEETCLDIMSWGMNEEAIALILMTPEAPGRNTKLYHQFHEWSRRHPAEAASWFENEFKKGNPLASKLLTGAPDLQYVSILAHLRADPDRGIALALARLAPDSSPSDLQDLGATTALTLADESEHRDYLAALRRAAAQSPGNPVLAGMRSGYLQQITNQFTDWSVDDAVSLIDSEFTPQEKQEAASIMCHYNDLDEPQKWAAWIAGVNWPPEQEHPGESYIQAWAYADYAAAGEWLDRYPAGAKKDSLIRSYSAFIFDKFPAEAARRVATLSAGPVRERTLQSLYWRWVDKDPEAAERFAKEHELEQ